ncbi:MAG TPA: Gfo/Idh/MocA family oxidoreductase [Candidatus Limnocylindria bacterium]|nr:Gfo/Idh/MocA family oxidoreductase [Candidatus Limnocylindria bacterium]
MKHHPLPNSNALSRRGFLTRSTVAATVLAFPFISRLPVLGANERLNIAGIGVGGKGWTDTTMCDSQNIVALCDVDDRSAANAWKRFPKARRFRDFRKMFDEMPRGIDAVTVSTPDHMHFPASMRAIKEKKHVYCQKPLTHTVWEARKLAETARKAGVATQMGNQGIANPLLRRDAEIVRSGILGDVVEMHCWTDRPGKWWSQAKPRPIETPTVPAGLDWDLWLGTSPVRPYHSNYVPFHWRAYWDFGTGAIGDMGCHLLNLAALSLDMSNPQWVEAESEGANSETGPQWSRVTWQFPARNGKPAFKFIWYDGAKLPPSELFHGSAPYAENGVLVVGTQDVLYVPSHMGGGILKSGRAGNDLKEVRALFPKSSDWERSHYEEWIAACKGGPKAYSNFDVAGPITETVLLGNVALRAGRRIEWDAKAFKVSNIKTANAFVRSPYRKGWDV